jgi:hypothetical protein
MILPILLICLAMSLTLALSISAAAGRSRHCADHRRCPACFLRGRWAPDHRGLLTYTP